MPHNCSFNEEDRVIAVRSHGEISLIDITTVLSDVERLRSETGVGLVFVDVRDQTANSLTLDISGISQKIYSGLVIAYWVASDQPTSNELSIMESLFKNKGCTIGRFTDRDDALNWLSSHSDRGDSEGLLKRLKDKLSGDK